MPRYIAYLRAINVGGRTVKMDRLRQLFEALHFANVETFIASGNVIFEAPGRSGRALEKKIAGHLGQALGYAVDTFVRTPAEVAAIAAFQPFPGLDPEAEGMSLYVAFLGAAPSAVALQRVAALQTAIDSFCVHGRELYWLCRTSMGQSTVSGATIEKALAAPATLRNVTTVRRLAEKYGSV